jgi:hypothetical protein
VDYQELADRIPEIVSVAAALGIALLIPLFLSQRRDIRRLRAFMERDPGYPAESVAASEAVLDHTETELERLTGETAAVTSEQTGAAARVTSERPALERVTMERAALQPHPRWRRFLAAASRPRVLVVVGIAALLLAVGGIFVSEKILDDGEGGAADRSGKAGRVIPGEVTVAVLNGTSEAGLADKVASDVGANGYAVGTVGGTNGQFPQTTVMFADGDRKAARKVARDLGLDADSVEGLDRETELLAGEANVVVIVGEDRAKP